MVHLSVEKWLTGPLLSFTCFGPCLSFRVSSESESEAGYFARRYDGRVVCTPSLYTRFAMIHRQRERGLVEEDFFSAHSFRPVQFS